MKTFEFIFYNQMEKTPNTYCQKLVNIHRKYLELRSLTILYYVYELLHCVYENRVNFLSKYFKMHHFDWVILSFYSESWCIDYENASKRHFHLKLFYSEGFVGSGFSYWLLAQRTVCSFNRRSVLTWFKLPSKVNAIERQHERR